MGTHAAGLDRLPAFSLPLVDMLIIMALAFTVVPVLETAKWMERKGWFGSMA
jgi:hypothetical protein